MMLGSAPGVNVGLSKITHVPTSLPVVWITKTNFTRILDVVALGAGIAV